MSKNERKPTHQRLTTRISSFVTSRSVHNTSIVTSSTDFCVQPSWAGSVGVEQDPERVHMFFLLLGILGVAISTYVLVADEKTAVKTENRGSSRHDHASSAESACQERRETSSAATTCSKKRDPCQKCNERMLITAIYREVKDKEKEKERSLLGQDDTTILNDHDRVLRLGNRFSACFNENRDTSSSVFEDQKFIESFFVMFLGNYVCQPALRKG